MFILDFSITFMTSTHEVSNVRKRVWTCASTVDSDHPAHSHSLVRNFLGNGWQAKDAKFFHANDEKFDITKTYLYNFDPLKPHFYIVKLGFTGVYIIFLISAQNIDCGYPQSMF